ncbi:MAG: phenylalanine--tRNA ligase subunit beta [Erysipelotrichaceae bacterium]
MKVSMKWLGRYVDLSGIKAENLAAKLTLAGLEVESIETLAQGTKLTIGHVLSCIEHPQSDHLHVCQVDLGHGTTQIVCGAPNVAAGQKVIVAQVGAVLPELTIKQAIVRGVESNGMICALYELGVAAKYLSEEQKNGIEVLGDDAIVGQDPLAYLGLDDVVLDVKQTPNRSDFNAMWSIAAEVGALLDCEVHLPDQRKAALGGKPTALKIGSTTPGCPTFYGKIVGKLNVKASPKWLKESLMAVGIKSINNVVDISNFVMCETGQPLHFYDLAKIPNREITVKDGLTSSVKTLDESSIPLLNDDLVITSGGVPIGLAGIMGGDDSKIDEATTGIIIEAALFSPVRIRNTSRRVNLQTEASLRFQKGLESQMPDKAMHRAVELLIELADAQDLEATVEYGKPDFTLKQVSVTHAHIEALLGIKVALSKCVELLGRLHLNPTVAGDVITCTIPSYRLDLTIAEDLIEEVGRLVGYDATAGTLPIMATVSGQLDDRQKQRRRIRALCTGFGMNEAITYTLVSKNKINTAVLPLGEAYEILSPLSDERRYVRVGLLPSLLETAAYNTAHKIKDFMLYEISAISALDKKEERLAFVLGGNITHSLWQNHGFAVDFYTGKGLLEAIANELGFDAARLRYVTPTIELDTFHPFRSAEVYLGKQRLGIIGEIHPKRAKELGVGALVIAEVNLELFLSQKASKIKFSVLNKFPVVQRDLALVMDEGVAAGTIEGVIKKAGKALVKEVRFFDIYTGSHVEAGKKSLALSVFYQADDHTLEESEITLLHNKILEALEKELGAKLRA